MSDLKELKRVFLEVREKLVAESHRLMAELSGCFEGDYEQAIGTVQRLLEVFEGLRVLSNHSESFLGALEAEDRVAEAKEKFKRHLGELAAPLTALKKHREALRTADLRHLQQILAKESGQPSIEVKIPDRIDPVVVELVRLFPDVLGGVIDEADAVAVTSPFGDAAGEVEENAHLARRDCIDEDLDSEKARLARDLAGSGTDGNHVFHVSSGTAYEQGKPTRLQQVEGGEPVESTESVLDEIFAGAPGASEGGAGSPAGTEPVDASSSCSAEGGCDKDVTVTGAVVDDGPAAGKGVQDVFHEAGEYGAGGGSGESADEPSVGAEMSSEEAMLAAIAEEAANEAINEAVGSGVFPDIAGMADGDDGEGERPAEYPERQG